MIGYKTPRERREIRLAFSEQLAGLSLSERVDAEYIEERSYLSRTIENMQKESGVLLGISSDLLDGAYSKFDNDKGLNGAVEGVLRDLGL